MNPFINRDRLDLKGPDIGLSTKLFQSSHNWTLFQAIPNFRKLWEYHHPSPQLSWDVHSLFLGCSHIIVLQNKSRRWVNN